MIFYNILLSRSLHRRLSQPFDSYKAINAYDFRSYTPYVNNEIIITHKPIFSYPDFFESYINLKERVIAYELAIIKLHQSDPVSLR